MENFDSEVSSLYEDSSLVSSNNVESCSETRPLVDLVESFIYSQDDDPTEQTLKDDDTRSELNFERDQESQEEKEKRGLIEEALNNELTKLKTWQDLAISKFGLVGDDLRCKIWPLLLEVDPSTDERTPSLTDLSTHPEYNQVLLDVNRSLKRFPPGIPYNQRLALQDQLTVLILRVIMKYPHLRYYQGYHDVAITFLLVVGEAVSFRIMEVLSTNHLKECMEPTMEKTDYRLNYIYALLYYVDRDLFNFMDSAGVGTMFALPWYLTWFGHSLNQYKDVVRLYDFFLAQPPLMPLYVATSLVISRRDEIFAEGCDMASIHCLLSRVPDNLDFETILTKASEYYKNHPPNKLEKMVKDRVQKEQTRRKNEENQRQNRLNRNRSRWVRLNNNIPRWLMFSVRSKCGLIFAAATVIIGYLYYVRYDEGQIPFLRPSSANESSNFKSDSDALNQSLELLGESSIKKSKLLFKYKLKFVLKTS